MSDIINSGTPAPEPAPAMTALVLDDHPVTRIGFRAALKAVRDMRVLEADTLQAARQVLERHPEVEIIIGDLALPDCTGLATVDALRSAAPSARLAITSGELPPELMLQCFRRGVRWFIDKGASPGMIRPVLESLVEGESLVPASLLEQAGGAQAERLSIDTAATPRLAPLPPETSISGISGRQADVALLLSRGLSNKEIAQVLGISPGTAKNYVARILELLEAPNRAQAALKLAQRISTTPPATS